MRSVLSRISAQTQRLPVVTVALCVAMALGFTGVHLFAHWRPARVGPAADALVAYVLKHPGATRDENLVRLAIRASKHAKDSEFSRRLLSEIERAEPNPAVKPEFERLRMALLSAARASPAIGG